ncbi:hypothetical protein BGX33_002214, partial [Mortierella sp. NVP41]
MQVDLQMEQKDEQMELVDNPEVVLHVEEQAAQQADAHANQQEDNQTQDQADEHMHDQADGELDDNGAPEQKTRGPMVKPIHRDPSGFVTTPVYSPDGKEILVGNGDYEILRFDTQSGLPLDPLRGHSGITTWIAYSLDGDMVASSSEDKTTRIWDPRAGRQLLALPEQLDDNSSIARTVAFSPFNYQVATGHDDGSIRLWRVTNGDPGFVLVGHTKPVLCVAYSPDGKFIASGSEDRTMRLWNAFTDQCLAVVRDFVVGVKTIQWKATQDELLLVTGCKENPLRVWQVVQEGVDGYDIRARWGAGPDALALSGA